MSASCICRSIRNQGSSFQAPSRLVAGQHRCFSNSSATRASAVPTFSKQSSTSELSALLNNVRKNVFLPAALSEYHRKLIYAKRRERSLRDDPITVEIKGEEFRLEYIDRTQGVPATKDTLMRFSKICRNGNDWSNLPALFQGFRTANRKIETSTVLSVIRKAGRYGHMAAVVECLRQLEKTKFPTDVEVLEDVLFWIVFPAATKGWPRSRIAKAHTLTMQFVKVAEANGLLNGKEAQQNRSYQTTVAASVLAPMAIGLKAEEEGFTQATTTTYASRFLDMTEDDPALAQAMPSPSSEASIHAKNHWLRRVSPVIMACNLAADVLPNQSEALLGRANAIKDRAEPLYQELVQAGAENSLGPSSYRAANQKVVIEPKDVPEEPVVEEPIAEV